MRTAVSSEGVKIRKADFNMRQAPCPECGRTCKRHSLGHRWLRDVGIRSPACIEVTYSKHYCPVCNMYFNNKMGNIAPAGSNYSNRVVSTSVDLVAKGLSLMAAKDHMLAKYHVTVPATTIHDWVKETGVQ